ncbi:methylated-DNA--[protein]-cysteine S-methyltransferase [Acidovorax sp. M2(2025)]|uniref:methylated-DNA--[protein]-cysteine S-methyltransferase n=1 Tax=Acidovorax sp. M2(2025) TaxID=3411355 RepID=UPI003BF47553
MQHPAEYGHHLFPTPLGSCGIAWGPAGIVAVQLPEADPAATRSRLLRGLPPPCLQGDAAVADGLLPPPVLAAVQGIQALLAGQPRDLREVPLDMSGVPAFHQQVYAIARAIAPGQTRTYGDVAQQLGSLGLARAVGQALGLNPFAPVVPCHRVLAAGGRPGGFSAGGGALTKLRMLEIEGASPGGTLPLFGALGDPR